MRAMKDSGIEWIGRIPQGWHVDRLKYCADLDREKLSEKTDPEYTFNYIDISSVTEYGGIGTTQEMTFEKSPSRARMVVRDGDTIISTVRTYLKAIAYIDGLEDHICSTGFCVVTPNEKIHPKFGYYLLQSDYFVQKIVSKSVGVSYPAISSTEIGNMAIAIPDAEEQARIAKYLDDKCTEIDALIAAKEKTNALLKERRQSIIYEAVTKGLNPDAPMKDSGIEWIGQIPKCWDMLRLRFLGAFQNGISKAGEFFGSGYPFVSYGDVYKNEVLPTVPSGLVESTESEREQYSVEKGDVFFTRTSETKEEIGIVAVCKETIPNATFAGFLIRMRPTTDVVSTDFLRYYFSCGLQREYFSKEMTLVTRASLGQDLLKNMVVTIPSVEEQKAIVNYLDEQTQAIDSIIANNDFSIQKLKEYRQGIIYEAVTGKIEV